MIPQDQLFESAITIHRFLNDNFGNTSSPFIVSGTNLWCIKNILHNQGFDVVSARGELITELLVHECAFVFFRSRNSTWTPSPTTAQVQAVRGAAERHRYVFRVLKFIQFEDTEFEFDDALFKDVIKALEIQRNGDHRVSQADECLMVECMRQVIVQSILESYTLYLLVAARLNDDVATIAVQF